MRTELGSFQQCTEQDAMSTNWNITGSSWTSWITTKWVMNHWHKLPREIWSLLLGDLQKPGHGSGQPALGISLEQGLDQLDPEVPPILSHSVIPWFCGNSDISAVFHNFPRQCIEIEKSTKQTSCFVFLSSTYCSGSSRYTLCCDK